jgi:hypothetical protein
MTDELIDAGHLYVNRYGKPEPFREDCCNAAVSSDPRWPHYYRCGNKVKVRRQVTHKGQVMELGYCGIHDPVKVAQKQAERNSKWKAEYEAKNAERNRAQAIKAAHDEAVTILRRISQGHNDPRTVAMQFIIRWDFLTQPVGED